MNREILMTISPEELKELIMEAVKTVNSEQQAMQLYTINQVSKRLKRSHTSIKRLCEAGVIQTTSDGRISELALKTYLKNEQKK